ncbi:MAG: hypothetical protein ACAI43_06155 [Phycisphaerae bacterium]|nr:hypothetical protein [Tepidisphaeraceae bacterium]
MRTFPIALASLLLAVAGCKSDHEKLMTQTTARMKAAVDILKSVTDEPTAKAAAPKLQGVAADLKRLQQDMNRLGEADQAVKKELAEKHGREFIETSRALASEIDRIRGIPAAHAALEQALRELNWNRLER